MNVNNTVVNPAVNSLNFQALQYNMNSNVEFLIQRLSQPILQFFDRLAETVILQASTAAADATNDSKKQAEDDLVDTILMRLSDAFAEPIQSSEITRIYDKCIYHSNTLLKAMPTFHFVQERQIEPIAIENILFEVLCAQRHLMLWSKDCEDQVNEAEMDILNSDRHGDDKDRAKQVQRLMMEFIELSLFAAKMKFIDRTGLFYARHPSIYESDQFIVQQEQVIQQAIRQALRNLSIRSFQLSSLVPFRKILAPVALLQQISEQNKRMQGRGSNNNTASTPLGDSANSAQLDSIHKLFKQLLEEVKTIKLENGAAIRDVNGSVEQIQLELHDANRLLQTSADIQHKHSVNVAEELHSLVQYAEEHQRNANNNHQPLQQAPQQQQPIPFMYITTPAAQKLPRQGEPDQPLYEYNHK